jgi:prepilin-type N-terminal cleavage/methylation domain-containing protein
VRRGFTLVEMLVVVAIIAILTAITIPAVMGVRRRADVKRTKTYLDTIRLALESYANDFGDYPPSRPQLVGLPSNGVNDGIEVMVRCLTTKKKNGPYFTFDSEVLDNSDGDSIKGLGGDPTDSTIASRELFEVKDPWGNPFVYIHNQDYDAAQTYLVGEPKERARIHAIKDAKTKSYLGPRAFQLLSLGPDGQQDQTDDGDDIVVWGGN